MDMMSRRAFLKLSALAAGGACLSALPACSVFEPDPGALVSSFFVVSDTHITAGIERNVNHFRTMLSDISSLDIQPSTIVIVGDIVNSGIQEEYDLIRSLCEEAGYDFDSDFVKVMGNHEQLYAYDGEIGPVNEEYRSDQLLLFLREAGLSRVYYDLYVDGLHFIVLGPDAWSTGWVPFNFTSRQMEWLDDLLAADEEAGELSFVFCHEPLQNTIHGSMEGSFGYRNSLIENEECASIMERYPHATYFSGHSHAYPDIKRPKPEGALYVNDGAVATGQVWAPASTYGGGFSGAFGIQVIVYEKRVDFRGRDFLEHEWINVKHKMTR
ncbi:MAG: metallophosphoesterase [Eggerthellaceae bacterium]|nr:metallophosphoesterase [Eggerthellaceae bacterium]